MEFHGIPKPSWEVPWNSMKLQKFHGTWSDTKFHGTLVPPNGLSPSSIEFYEILNELWCRLMKYHWVPWNSMELWDCHLINTMLPWTCMGYSMEFHGTMQSPSKKNHRVLSDSMELGGRHFKWHKNSMEFHGKFHRIPWNFGAAKWNIT